jgi:AraC family transcriptional regulator
MDSSEVATVPGGTRLHDHAHETVHAAVVLSGGFSEREATGWRDMTPGVLRVSAAASHDLNFGSHLTRCLVLEAEPEFPGHALRRLVRPQFLALDPWLHQLVRHLAAGQVDDSPYGMIRQGSLRTELFAQLERRIDGRSASPPPWLTAVRERLHDVCGRVSVAELAAGAQVHRVHMARAFRDHFGVPITVYARRIQVDNAQRLLTTSAMPLSQVAAVAGFADQSHLTRTMRSTLGCTPGVVRRAALHRFKTATRAAG